METMIPFTGFYETGHSAELDRAVEMDLADTSGNPIGGLVEHSIGVVPWRELHEKYAREYVEVFERVYGITNVKFSEMISPREYNFGTDRIFAEIPESEIKRIHSETPQETIEDVVGELFTSCSGFCSHYSPNVSVWGELDQWDHNQLYALILAWIRSRDDVPNDVIEFDDDWYGGGAFEFCMQLTGEIESVEYNRLCTIARYLRDREERSIL